MSQEKQKKHSEELFQAADKLIKRVQKADETEEAEAEASFRVVMERVRKEKFIPTHRHMYQWAACAAAIVTLSLFAYFYETGRELPASTFDIALLDQNSTSASSREVTLITSQSTMNLKDSTSLKYDQRGASNAQQYLLKKVNQTDSSPHKTHQIIVPKGKRANVTLSDGTKIYINSGSKVIYPELFSENQREVLVEGEVYLEVAPHKECPFIVKTRNFDLKVLGTAFNISAYRDEKEASVVLVHGSVEVTTENKSKMQLKPNQLMSIHGNQASISSVNVSEYISWKDNLLLLEHRPLKQIFDKLERYYGCTISCSKEVAALSLSGKLDLHASITTMMDNLCLFLSLGYTINDDQEIIVHLKQESITNPLKEE